MSGKGWQKLCGDCMNKKSKNIKLKNADYLYFSRCGRYLATSKVQGRIHLYGLPDRTLLWAGKH